MPTPEDLERLRALAEAEPATEREAEAFDDEAKTRQGPHVSVHVHQHEKKERGHPLHKLAESGWAKAVVVVLLGAGGSEGHRLVAATGLVGKGDLDEHKKEMARELGRADARIDALRSEIVAARQPGAQARTETRALAIYLYGVLPKLGVQVTLPEGVEPPGRMEFHPPPLTLSVGPNAAKPIQPAQVFPLPTGSP